MVTYSDKYLAATRTVFVVVRLLNVDVPGGLTVETLVRCVTSPQTLDQHGCGWDLPVEVLLSLLLLYFKSKT